MNKQIARLFSATLITVLVLSTLASVHFSVAAAPARFANPTTTVFINEIHYDNTSTDSGEAIEIAGPAGTDLTGWSIVLYNGNGGGSYDTDALTGVIPNQQQGYGTVYLAYASNGIQNGAPDGIALVDASNTVVQFLSYEGTFTATSGPANGLASTDIGISQTESETIGSSLQLTGSGNTYGQFHWISTSASTFDSPNTGQSFAGSDVAPLVTATEPIATATNVAINSNLEVAFSEDVNATAASFSIACETSGAHTAAISGGPAVYTLNPDTDFANSETCTVTVLAAQVTDQDSNDPPDNLTADFIFSFSTVNAAIANALVINEIDYDQPSTDTAEFVEIRNNDSVNVDLSAYSIQMINGNSGGAAQYRLFALPAVNLAPDDYFVLCANNTTVANCDLDVTPETDLVQNGAPDAVALLFNGTIIDTVSYEGETGAPYTETSGTGLIDSASGTQSISRCPDGQDTNTNNVDFSERASTPGAANFCTTDTQPTVTNTLPASSATNVLTTSNIEITFSEAVTVTGNWFSISCTTTGAHTATATGGPITFNINPDSDFSAGETCSVSVLAAQVTDQDGLPNNLAADYSFSFSTEGPVCEQNFTPIYQIQGNGTAAAITGNVTTQGVVVGDFEGTAQASGFYLQDLTGDGDTATSDGLFVMTGTANLVNVGDVVRVTGYARERFNQTTLNGSNSNTAAVPAANIVNCGAGSVAPVDVTMPFADANYLERFEGMLVRFPQSLTIAEYFNYDRFGEIVLALPLDGETRPYTGTAIDAPGAAANARTLANSLRRITLDDFNSSQNPSVLRHPNGLPFSLTNLFRGGDQVQNAIGVLGYDFSLYRIIPTGPADYTATNPRPAAPEPVGGTVRVAAMNTLNYFVTADYPTGDPLDNKCGPANNVECRGWDSDQVDEFTRQRDKLLTALSGLNADIIGLNELENSTGVEPLADIVAGLPGYAYINTGVIGTDAIKVGMIYRPTVVTPVGDFKLLTSAVDPRFIDTKSRPALAQTFEVIATGARFTVVVNHFKSKGSACDDIGDPDLLDGQGNCSQTRRAAAEALVDWLATDPTGSSDPDFIIMGDLNSYAMEDTLTEIKAGADDTVGTSDDFTNLIAHFQGAYAYSYTFDGQAGYLDHALANASLLPQITGAEEWHINSDEPDVLDYDTSFKPAAQEALYEINAYRTSDHDAVVIGLNPNAAPTVNANGPYSVNEGDSVTLAASGSDPNSDPLTYAWDLDNNGSYETNGQNVAFAGLDGPASYTVNVQVTDPGGLSATTTATVTVNNLAPVVGAITAPNTPVKVSTPVNASASFTDAGSLDTHSALWDWGDGTTSTGTVTETNGSGSVAGSHNYTKAGLFTVALTVTDKDGDSHQSTYQTVIVYNPNGGFITGGGWINSPAGAYLEKPTKKGLAITAFVVKYLRNSSSVPSGNFDFMFLAGNLQFRATSFDWLVVDQTSKTAIFQGTGKINGKGTYKFMVWADDDRPDNLRIKIWKTDGTVIYDTSSALPLLRGSIIVHR